MRLPVPTISRPLPIVDPFRSRLAYWSMIGELNRAEEAALEGFSLLSDPAFVDADATFLRAMNRLMEDEARHATYYQDMIATLGYDQMAPVLSTSDAFFTEYRTGRRFALPLRPSVAALFCMFSEGLGYAFLAHMRDATVEAEFKRLLAEHVADEESHLRVSMTVLRRALHEEGPQVLLDLIPHTLGYLLLARHPVLAGRQVAQALGFDFFDVGSSCLRFVRDMLLIVLEDAGYLADARRGRLLQTLTAPFLSAEGLQLSLLSAPLPDPPLFWRALVAFGRARRSSALAPARTSARTSV